MHQKKCLHSVVSQLNWPRRLRRVFAKIFFLNAIEDIYGTSGIPVLVIIPRYHPNFGKDHRLLVLHESDSFVAAQYRLLYTKIHDLSQGNAHKILAITSALQNEGKTVTALNLAVVMARDFGKKTLVLEGDFRRP